MKLCVAQTHPVKGDIAANLIAHKRLVEAAVSQTADLIIFPELSLTGYEPTLASNLAMTIDDPRLDDLQQISDNRRIVIGVGAPLKRDGGVVIGLILFQPDQPRKVYAKHYLHPDEYPFFVSSSNCTLNVNGTEIALAICYEISVPEHTSEVFRKSPSIYVASVAKVSRGIERALDTLASTARQFETPVLMANNVGPCDGETGAGRSSAWDNEGNLIGQLADNTEGVLMLDTETMKITAINFQEAY